MAGSDVDLEKAFTNGDPEAVLDFLAIRSRHHRRSEDNVSVSSVPIFSSDNDMAAFVRDLTIDDAISHCFADVPSDCGDSVTSSAPMLMPSRPEKKLTDSGTAARSTSACKQSSETKRRLVSTRQSMPSKHHPHSANRSPRGKPRGFLSSLLGRGHKGRRGADQSKSTYRQKDVSFKYPEQSPVPGPVFSFSGNSMITPPVYDPGVGTTLPYDASAPSLKSQVLPEVFTDVHSNHSVFRHQKKHVKHNNVEVLRVVEGVAGQVTLHNTDPVSVMKLGSPQKDTEASKVVNRKPETTTQHTNPTVTKSGAHCRHAVNDPHFPHSYIKSSSVKAHSETVHPFQTGQDGKDQGVSLLHSHNGSSVSHNLTEKVHGASGHSATHSGNSAKETGVETLDLLPPHTPTHSVKGSVSEKNQTLHPDLKYVHASKHLGSKENHKHKSDIKEHTKHKPSDKEDPKLNSQKPWEALCDGIDAFIDFERDPNVEVPLNPHLKEQFDFKRRSSGDENQYEVLAKKSQVVENYQSPNVTVQASALTCVEQTSNTSDDELVLQASCQATVAQCAHESKSRTSNCQVSSPITLKVSASTQTEDLKFVSSEKTGSPRVGHCLRTAITQLSTLASCSTCENVISRTLIDLKKALSEIEGETAPSEDTADPFFEKQADKAPSNEAVIENMPEVPSPHSAEALITSGFVENRTHDSKSSPRGYSQQLAGHCETACEPSSKSTTTNQKPQHSIKRSKQHVAEKLVTSFKVSAEDCDSDSTSTVTSEPTTVLICNKANSSSPKSSSAGGVSGKFVAGKHPFDLDDDHGVRNPEVKKSSSSSGKEGNPFPTSTCSVMKTEDKVAQSTTNVKAVNMSRTNTRTHRNIRGSSRYAGEADRDYESFVTSSWSEMTSVSSVSDVVTSADESSYYSGDDDDNDDEDEEEEEGVTMVRLGLLDEDRDDSELRQHRLQRHLAAVLRQSTIPTSTVETVVAATGERLNSQDRHVQHVNQGSMYPFSAPAHFAEVPASREVSTPVCHPTRGSERRGREEWVRPSASLQSAPPPPASFSRDGRTFGKSKKGGATPRLFSPERQVSLVAARQMTSEEFREGYDRSTDISKLKRSQLDGDIPWDLIPCSDTDDDAGSDKAWYNITSEEESLAHACGSDTDSSSTVSDW